MGDAFSDSSNSCPQCGEDHTEYGRTKRGACVTAAERHKLKMDELDWHIRRCKDDLTKLEARRSKLLKG